MKQTIYNLYKTSRSLWEFCLVKNGRYIGGSKQGYVARAGAVNAIRLMNPLAKFQDDTKGDVYCFHEDTGKVVACPNLKGIKVYQP